MSSRHHICLSAKDKSATKQYINKRGRGGCAHASHFHAQHPSASRSQFPLLSRRVANCRTVQTQSAAQNSVCFNLLRVHLPPPLPPSKMAAGHGHVRTVNLRGNPTVEVSIFFFSSERRGWSGVGRCQWRQDKIRAINLGGNQRGEAYGEVGKAGRKTRVTTGETTQQL